MKAFLYQVAEAYFNNERNQMADLCFVFPNRRSSSFFRHHLADIAHDTPMFMPATATVGQLAADSSNLIEATRDEAMFVLYNCYRKLAGDADVSSFERFVYWGGMLLDDFNEIDRNIIDADTLFVNVERWREIRSFYITEEQARIIKRYWGEEVVSADAVDAFWHHVNSCPNHFDTGASGNYKFLKLWEIMAPLYHEFTASMRANGLATKGMLFRDMVDAVDSGESRVLADAQKYVFVGFDVPTIGEVKLFSMLQRQGRADFYWDFDIPVPGCNSNRLHSLMSNLKSDFMSLYQLDMDRVDEFAEIEIVGVPSESGQTKVAGDTLVKWIEAGYVADKDNPVDTALVLPDESLFVPMIHAVPQEIQSMNVTMGLPFRVTSLSGLLGLITSMHIRSRISSKGENLYFYEDVEGVISHPLVQMTLTESAVKLLSDIRVNRRYNVSSLYVEANYPELSFIFSTSPVDNNADNAYKYLSGLLDFLASSGHDDPRMALELYLVDTLRDQLKELYAAVRRFAVDMYESTFMRLFERMLYSVSVQFEGKPIEGLQIMGVLETRALDFDNVVIMSLNERIFPKKNFVRSFIPDSLRRCYGLPTPELAEARTGYYFFRLLARAKHVMLLHDSRGGTNHNSEMSRFVTQLIYLGRVRSLKHYSAVFSGNSFGVEPLALPKSEDIMRRLREYEAGGNDKKYLSASALKTYLNCPLEFCLKYLMELNVDDEITDFMEASTLGNIVHEVFERLYKSIQPDSDGLRHVHSDIIKGWIDDSRLVERLITVAINRNYSAPTTPEDAPLEGESLVIGKVIQHLVMGTLRQELAFCPFVLVDAERRMKVYWKVNDGLMLKFRQVIDRIDIVNGIMRVVDYKTGDESLSLSNFDSMFTPGLYDKQRAIFQVLLYCELLAKEPGCELRPIQPYLYTLHNVLKQGFTPISTDRGKTVLADYHQVSSEFRKRLDALLSEIFDPSIPFIQAKDDKGCKFCNFKMICGRVTKED